MSSWIGGHADEAALLALSGPIDRPLADLRAGAARECPGRTATLIDARMRRLIVGDSGPAALADDVPLADDEQVVVALAEQFLLDAHGIDDELMARLAAHYTPSEQIAILFQVAFADGFTKLQRLTGLDDPTGTHPTGTDPSEGVA